MRELNLQPWLDFPVASGKWPLGEAANPWLEELNSLEETGLTRVPSYSSVG